MQNVVFALEGAWQVLLAGLVLGCGLPVFYALGIRSLAWARAGAAEVDRDARPHPMGWVFAVLCGLIVAFAIITGLLVIIAPGFGMSVSFAHVFPTLVPKG